MIIPEYPNHMLSQLNLKWPLIEVTLCNVSTSSNAKKEHTAETREDWDEFLILIRLKIYTFQLNCQ